MATRSARSRRACSGHRRCSRTWRCSLVLRRWDSRRRPSLRSGRTTSPTTLMMTTTRVASRRPLRSGTRRGCCKATTSVRSRMAGSGSYRSSGRCTFAIRRWDSRRTPSSRRPERPPADVVAVLGGILGRRVGGAEGGGDGGRGGTTTWEGWTELYSI
jgi:hypothetical protein